MYTYVVQSCLADRIIFDAQHLHNLLHFAEDLSQRDVLWLQLVLNLCVVPLLMWKNMQKFTIFNCKWSNLKIYSNVCLVLSALHKNTLRELPASLKTHRLIYSITIQTDNIEVLVYYGHLFWRKLSWCTAAIWNIYILRTRVGLKRTFRMASGKFLLKNRITSLMLAMVLVRTVIMYPSPNLKEKKKR